MKNVEKILHQIQLQTLQEIPITWVTILHGRDEQTLSPVLTSAPQEAVHFNFANFRLHDLHVSLVIPRFDVEENGRFCDGPDLL